MKALVKLALAASLAVGATVMCVTSASAASAIDDVVQSNRDQIATLNQRLHALRDAINSNQGSRVDQFKEYLHEAMYLVYLGKSTANLKWTDLDATNDDLTKLVDLGYLPEWPGNPLDDWKPMRVLATGDPFSAGDLVFDLCPSSEVTTRDGHGYRSSFNLYIYGLEEVTAGPTDPGLKENRGWSHVPGSALYVVGFHRANDQDMAEMRARAKARRVQEAAQKAAPPAQPAH
jgi:hypothetical protein